ncbi:LppU/SCO3897 family protein [Mycolicibacterium canariasense]|uniref:LppU/SCO3897 family protein n=1 Tax=Mycolicibacterium canariasense TaxID=228230 RepID=UPI0032D5A013
MTDLQPPAAPPVAKTRWWRTKKARLAFTIIGVSLILLAKFSLAEKHQVQQATTAAKQEITSFLVGDCVALGADGKDVHRTDCGVDPSFTVGAVLDSDRACANANYISYDWTLDHRAVGRLCLVENLTAGHCYHPTADGKNLEQTDCTTTDDKAYKVIQRFDSAAAQCPADATTYSYPKPVRTYCLTAP